MPGLKSIPLSCTRMREHTCLPLSFLQHGHCLCEAFPDSATLSLQGWLLPGTLGIAPKIPYHRI